MSLFALCLFLLTAATAPAGEIPLPRSNSVQGWEKSGPELRFSARDLYGHINGGAELFLEFGFENLRVQRYRKGDVEIALELYRMEDPAGALGIYLMKSGRETPSPLLEVRHTFNAYQISLVKADHFVLVNNFAGKQAGKSAMIALAAHAAAAIPEAGAVKLFEVLPERGLVEGSERIFRGPYALDPVFTFGRGDLLGLEGKVYGVLADYEGEQGETFTRLVVDYPFRQDALNAFTALKEGLDPGLSIVEEHAGWFSFADAWERYGVVDLRSAQLNLKIGLTAPPGLSDDR